MIREERREQFAAKNLRRRAEKRRLDSRYAEVRAARRALRPIPGAFGTAAADQLRRLT